MSECFRTDWKLLPVPGPVLELTKIFGGSRFVSGGFLPMGPVLGYLDPHVQNTA